MTESTSFCVGDLQRREMLMHVKPGVRTSWGSNAKKAWHVGPELKHYRAFRGVVPSTKGEHILDSVKF